MKYCERCGVSVSGTAKKCPLCQHTLTDNGGQCRDTFPQIETIYQSHGLLLRILLFGLITVSIISTMLDLMIPHRSFWSLWVDMGAACVWISIIAAVKLRGAFQRKMLNMAVLVSLFSLVWDVFTGWHRWSIDYVIPGVLICCMLVSLILVIVSKLTAQRYAVYLLILDLFGFVVPGVTLLFNWNKQRLPSFICITTSMIILAALMVFQRPMTQNELKRRLHL